MVKKSVFDVGAKSDAEEAEKPVKKTPKVTPAKPKKKGTTPTGTGTYKLGEKKYNPRVEHNAEAWDKVVSAITIKGRGKATHKELCSVLEAHFSKSEENHYDFVGYMERRGSIELVK